MFSNLISNGNSKSQIGYIIKQYRKYRKKNGRTRKYFSYCYMYNNGEKLVKKYIPKDKVEEVKLAISLARKNRESILNHSFDLLNQCKQYIALKDSVIKDFKIKQQANRLFITEGGCKYINSLNRLEVI